MARRWSPGELIAVVAAAGIGLLLALIVGLRAFMSFTATPLHPDPAGVSAVADEEAAAWRDAVQRARDVVRDALVEQNVPALSVAVAIDGRLVWAEAFGWADLERHTSATPATLFPVGTASKVLTSVAVGALVEDERLSFDEPIQTYVPRYPAKAWPVTVAQLMAHTGGVRPDRGDEEPVREHCTGTLDALDRFADTDLRFEPGTRYLYSSYGWILVSGAVEHASGRPFDEFMTERIFAPGGMTHTRIDEGPGSSPDRATYYFPRFAGDPRYGPQAPDREDFSCFTGSAGFLSTPADLVRFGLALDRGDLLRPETLAHLQSPMRLPSGEETGYGLGWDIEPLSINGRTTQTVGYEGYLRAGPVMSYLSFPDRDLIIVVMSNTSYADTRAPSLRIAEIFDQVRTARDSKP